MKPRATVILTLRIDKTLLHQLDARVPKSQLKSRNAWLLWAVREGLRDRHGKTQGIPE